jgi:hypothetical protein
MEIKTFSETVKEVEKLAKENNMKDSYPFKAGVWEQKYRYLLQQFDKLQKENEDMKTFIKYHLPNRP